MIFIFDRKGNVTYQSAGPLQRLEAVTADDVEAQAGLPLGYIQVETIWFTAEQSESPSAPADGNAVLYTKDDGKLYYRSFDVKETDITGAGIDPLGIQVFS
jgi:hypothetical protein